MKLLQTATIPPRNNYKYQVFLCQLGGARGSNLWNLLESKPIFSMDFVAALIYIDCIQKLHSITFNQLSQWNLLLLQKSTTRLTMSRDQRSAIRTSSFIQNPLQRNSINAERNTPSNFLLSSSPSYSPKKIKRDERLC